MSLQAQPDTAAMPDRDVTWSTVPGTSAQARTVQPESRRSRPAGTVDSGSTAGSPPV